MGKIPKNNNLWTILKDRPWLILHRNEHLLHRLEGFFSGMMYARECHELDNEVLIDLIMDLHNGVANKLECHPVVWFDTLLERNGNDEGLAFKQAVEILGEMGEARGLWPTEYVEPDPYCGYPPGSKIDDD
jgi:hypothetical protein